MAFNGCDGCRVSFEEPQAWHQDVVVTKIASFYVLDEWEDQVFEERLLILIFFVFSGKHRSVVLEEEVKDVDRKLYCSLLDHVNFVGMVFLLIEGVTFEQL